MESSSWYSPAPVAISVGPADLPLGGVLRALLSRIPGLGVRSGLNPIDNGILFDIRAPRIVLGGIVGATLALSGASYQGVFQNALADPYLLGVASGAGLGATVAIAVAHAALRSTSACCRSPHSRVPSAPSSATYALAEERQAPQHPELLLAGVAVGSFLTAIQTFVHNAPSRPCSRRTHGSSAASQPPRGDRSRWSSPTWRSLERSCCRAGGSSTCSPSATKRRRAWG